MKAFKKFLCAIAAMALFSGLFYPACVNAADADCKVLAAAALRASGGSGNLKYKSESAMDFGAFSVSDRNRVRQIMYICDEREVYSICVAKAKKGSDAKKLLDSLKKYMKSNNNSDYLSDYSETERKVLKNAVCAKKGRYVWYIAMSPAKQDNKKAQNAIRKKL